MVDFDGLLNGPVATVFGEGFTYQPTSGVSYPVQGVWAEPYRRQEFDDDGSSKWITVAPSVGLQLSTLEATIAKHDRITRTATGAVYRFGEVHPDGVGWVNISLMVSA